jgi:glutamine synthetase
MEPLYVFYRFISYTGEALDNKIPLLRALSAMDTAATEV